MSLTGCIGADGTPERSAEDLLSEIDSDGDGVLNNQDLCPDTTPENASSVNATGCYNPDTWTDDDGDGVVNAEDACPETESNQPVFLNGCSMTELDQDEDGVIDVYDECPGSNPEIPTLPNGCQDVYDGDIIVSPVKTQSMKNYEFELPHNPVLIGFNVGDGEGRFAVNQGPFATQTGYQLVFGTVLDGSFKSPSNSNKLMLHFSNLQSIQDIPTYLSTLEEVEGGYGGLYYNSSSGENHLNYALEYYIWAVPIMTDMSMYDTPAEPVLEGSIPCGKPPTERFEVNFPGDGLNNVSFYDFSGRVVVVEFGAEWCVPCKLLLEELNALQSDMRSIGVDENQFQILSFTLEDIERNPVTAEQAVQRQDGESLNFGMGGTVSAGYQLIKGVTGIWPTLMILAPNPLADEGLVVVDVGSSELIELFNSKSKIERLYSGQFTDELCNDEDSNLDSISVYYDPDIDGDGVENTVDVFPKDSTEWADLDKDGIGDNTDQDDDGDGVEDDRDLCPFTEMAYFTNLSTLEENGCADIDGDGFNQTNDCDDLVFAYNIDSDGDSYCDELDAFPNDPLDWADFDNDGVGDNTDAFPTNPSEQYDNDGDGVGDNQDSCLGTDANATNVLDDGCEDADMDGFSWVSDCDDNNSDLSPNSDEIEDGIDNNCNTYIDEGYKYPILVNINVSFSSSFISCDVTTQSVSGAPVRVWYVWSVNGVFMDDDTTFNLPLSNEYFSKGDIVVCSAQVEDDFFSLIEFDSEDPILQNLTGFSQLIVPNSIPVMNGNPSISIMDDQLYCTPTSASDADGDTVSFTFDWYRNGVYHSSGQSLNAALESGDQWTCHVTPTDGEDDGPTEVASYTVP